MKKIKKIALFLLLFGFVISPLLVNAQVPMPKITKISPKSGSVGTEVTIKGINFRPDCRKNVPTENCNMHVCFGKREKPACVFGPEMPIKWSDKEIKVKVPEGAITGPIHLFYLHTYPNKPNPEEDYFSVEYYTNTGVIFTVILGGPGGFILEFPETWRNHITKHRTLNWGLYGTSDSIDFGFPEQDSVFNISILEKDQWKKIISEEGPLPTYLGENDKYVFAYGVCQDVVNETMAKRREEVFSIIKTFRLEKVITTMPEVIKLIRAKGTAGVYLIDEQTKSALPIPDKVIFESYNFKWGDVKEVEKKVIDAYQVSKPVGLKEGVLVKAPDKSTVYVVKEGELLPITSPSVFKREGYKWTDIKVVPEKVIELHYIGEVLK